MTKEFLGNPINLFAFVYPLRTYAQILCLLYENDQKVHCDCTEKKYENTIASVRNQNFKIANI